MREKSMTLVAVVLGGFILYTSAAGPFESLVHRSIFLALVIGLGLLSFPLGTGRSWRPLGIAVDVALGAGAILACGYITLNAETILTTLPWASTRDMLLAGVLVVAILEVARRAIGWVFPMLVLLGIGYALLGNYIEGPLSHRGFDAAFVTETLYLGDLGIWGMLLGVAATTIAAFVLFGSLLLHTGGGQTFIDLSMRIGGRSQGGAAKIATVASSLFAMVSGSAVANVATTGNFTIPMMKRLNYPSAFSGGVESVASTGGQIAPPILGAAAFIMAEILGTSYVNIALAALLPALLFYVAVFVTLHLVAIRQGLPLVPEADLPDWAEVLQFRRILPIVAALGGLFGGVLKGYSIQYAAFLGVALLTLSYGGFAIRDRIPLTRVLGMLLSGLQDAGKGMVIIGVLLAGAQILVSMLNMTGIGVTLSTLVVSAAGEQLFLVALIVALICLIMGMGIPTTAAYVLVAAVLAPALTEIGVEPLVAHLFVFYFATISVITPPVCIAVFVAAGIAQTGWIQVAGHALRLGATTYIIPFLILAYPALAGLGNVWDITLAAFKALAFVLAFAGVLGGARVIGRRWLDSGLLAAAGLLAVMPAALPSLAGLAGLVGLYAWGWQTTRRIDIQGANR
ncbi:TRAP transporter permease [Halomonas piscis]|uniref:TRAP transporter permease n=1 Tax=Halomonas piscis TaxID=3031727 RepID=UPI00289B2FDB|nr:TRAP transporter fused permease subunit [Halomonas piscis]